MHKCQAIKGDGQRCERVVGPSQSFCYSHDPGRQAERKRNAAKAGRGNASSEIRELKSLLSELYGDVRAGRIETSVGACCVQVVNARLRALTVEKDLKDQQELEERIEALETRGIA